ncbi:type IV secretion system protein [Cellulomonas sp. URHD0024]|uniref:type IV secretion system protein n=1 Tax=Cellulomonas sp. URHD0024 TaxID=1302620 RepID=UPI0018CA09DB|nr:type IV secretion system protein [Cellulomonas sp. URHD0024]
MTVISAIAFPVVVALFVLQVLTSALRREPGGLLRALVGVGKAMIGAGLALAVTQLALTATDEICTYIASSADVTVSQAAARFFEFNSLMQYDPGLQLMLGLLLVVGFLLLWGVLLFRKAALILVAVFAPIAFAGSAWDQTRAWTRHWLEVVAALVFCKIVIVVAFVVGASAFTGSGPTTSGQSSSQPVAGGGGALGDALVGVLLLAIAIWAPWLTWRFVHWSGMEAAGVMHSTMAANPISKAAGASRVLAKQAAVTAVTGGVGSAVHAATTNQGPKPTAHPGGEQS